MAAAVALGAAPAAATDETVIVMEYVVGGVIFVPNSSVYQAADGPQVGNRCVLDCEIRAPLLSQVEVRVVDLDGDPVQFVWNAAGTSGVATGSATVTLTGSWEKVRVYPDAMSIAGTVTFSY